MTTTLPHRLRIYTPGGRDRLIVEEFAMPKVTKPNELLIRVDFAGINYADVCIRWGLYASAKKYEDFPGHGSITPGFEFSGKVIEVGNEVTEFKVNDEVFGCTRFNAQATHLLVPETQVFHLPQCWTPKEWAAFPAVTLTAEWAIHLADVQEGYRVLIHSVAGGVGSALAQLCKIRNAFVVGVGKQISHSGEDQSRAKPAARHFGKCRLACRLVVAERSPVYLTNIASVGRTEKVDYAKSLGCDVVIDKSKDKLWELAMRSAPGEIDEMVGFDAVFDANGVETLAASYDALCSGGRLIVYGFHTMLPKGSKTGALDVFSYPKLAWNWMRSPTFDPLKLTAENKSVLAFNLSFFFHKTAQFRKIAERLVALALEGKTPGGPFTTTNRKFKTLIHYQLHPPRIYKEYSLREVRQAHADIESGQTMGKLVVDLRTVPPKKL